MKIEKLSPAFKDYLWGGTKLRDVYGKKCDYEKVAESWELSTHPAGQSVIDGGEYDGLKFGEYLEKVGAKALGVNGAKFKEFPVLIKFIDAKQPLSVQVHPSDEYALRVEGEYGKTEMWYVVDCEPGASLYFGVNRALTKEEFKKRIEDNTLTDVLYPADEHIQGKELRLRQQYFFVSASVQRAVAKYMTNHDDIHGLPEKVCLMLQNS